jgi:hypothetical protein
MPHELLVASTVGVGDSPRLNVIAQEASLPGSLMTSTSANNNSRNNNLGECATCSQLMLVGGVVDV